MEHEITFNAARDGKLSELKDVLEHKPEGEVRALVSAVTNDSTPLIKACVNGHLDVVIYLLEKCHADIEQNVKVEHRRLKPLLCAVYSGHLNVVKALIEHGAAVNDDDIHKSPFVEACIKGNFEMVKYLVEHGADINLAGNEDVFRRCLLYTSVRGYYKIVKYLLECGADVNSKNEYDETALHACIRSDSYSLEMAKMLLQHGARVSQNEYGLTQLLYASSIGCISFVEYFIDECNCSKEDKVNALELLGATLVDEGYLELMVAPGYWRRAMHLRYEDEAFRLEKPIDKSPFSSYANAIEVCTFDQLDQLTDDEMEIQALMIRERILGPGHDDSILHIQRRGEMYAEEGDFERCIHLWLYVLEGEIGRLASGELGRFERDLADVFHGSFIPLTKLFYKIMSENWNFEKGAPVLSFWEILKVFNCALKAIEVACLHHDLDTLKFGYYRYVLVLTMHLLSLMCRLQSYLTPDEEKSLKQAACNLVHMNLKGENGFTVLHIASFKYSSDVYDIRDDGDIERFRLSESAFPSVAVVNLLLEVGACPNARDSSNNTPLHAAAMNRPCPLDIFYALLRQGAHIELYNNENKTPLQLLDDVSQLDVHPLQHLKLQCLCAQAIDRHKIPYKGLVHNMLCEFVDMHGLGEPI